MSDSEQTIGRARHGRIGLELPAWAQWCTDAAARPWTVGVEEEAMLLDARTGAPANRIDDVLAALPSGLRSRASPETHACVVELRTEAHVTVGGVTDELVALRSGLEQALAPLGLRAAAAGTHPLAQQDDVDVSTGARYREIEASMRALARREPTMALHVHVAVPDAQAAVRALDGLRADLPVLLALAANSPFWRGEDSGFASIRAPVFSMFPRAGIPRQFGTYRDYVRVVERLLRSGAVREPGFLWWDARLQPRLGTLEVRMLDAAMQVGDAAAVAALVQCLVRRHAEAWRARAPEPEVLAENRFLAARDGTRAEFVDGFGERSRPVRDHLDEVLDTCRPYAAALGCAGELAAVAALAADPGDARQRRLAAVHGLERLPTLLGDAFAPERSRLAAA
jgi:glutamate---cysteine ligase / carboxylate-amine ligase